MTCFLSFYKYDVLDSVPSRFVSHTQIIILAVSVSLARGAYGCGTVHTDRQQPYTLLSLTCCKPGKYDTQRAGCRVLTLAVVRHNGLASRGMSSLTSFVLVIFVLGIQCKL
jgi:hypothetical protein